MSESDVQTTVVKLDKEEARLLRWVQSAQAKGDTRPLNGINRTVAVQACDGFRMHAIPDDSIPDDIPEGNSDLGKVPAAGGIIEVTPNDLSYPDTHQVMPNSKMDVFRVGVNPKLLMDALKGQKGMVILQFYNPDTASDASYTTPFEVYGRIDDTPVYALIMPMHIGRTSYNDDIIPSTWRPGREV